MYNFYGKLYVYIRFLLCDQAYVRHRHSLRTIESDKIVCVCVKQKSRISPRYPAYQAWTGSHGVYNVKRLYMGW